VARPDRAVTEFSVVIPGNPPAVNSSYRAVPTKQGLRFHKLASVATWQDTAAWLTRAQRPAEWQPSRRVRVEVAWWTARTRDADAGLKALLDALATGLGINDSCFLPTVISNEVDSKNPRTEVTLRNES
jgi:Holliday junction resolvase RusA-like endonuclease